MLYIVCPYLSSVSSLCTLIAHPYTHIFAISQYVDLEYEGGGIGEYQYYDRYNNKWDATSCQVSGNNRCAKMDCHLENTHFSLLGFFKHKSYDDWMEQLFKHLGMCIWTDEQYSFMKNARKAWPQGCTSSGRTTNDGKTIYYDIKPIRGGDIVVGLYTDTQCVNEYSGGQSSITVDNILGNFLVNGGSGDKNKNNNGGYYDYSYESLSDSYSRWNDAFDAFHICQPCVAYDLQNVYGYTYSDNGDQFDCYDDAGYTNVNQVRIIICCIICLCIDVGWLHLLCCHMNPLSLSEPLPISTHLLNVYTVHEIHGQDEDEYRNLP